MKNITVVGCGNMGSAIVSAFMNDNFQVSIVDLNEEGAKSFIERGAKYYSELVNVTETELILFNLPSNKIVMNILEDLPDNYLEGKNIINTTTATPKESLEVCEYIESKGARCLDCKIECYPPEVGSEYSVFTYCGNKSLFGELEDTLKSLSPQPWYMGESYTTCSVIDVAAIETQYALRYAILEGIGLAIKNDANILAWLDMVEMGMPGILQVSRRQFTKAFIDHKYDGKFDDSAEASIETDYHGLNTVQNTFKESGIRASFNKKMIEIYKEALEDELGSKEDVAIMNEILK